VLGGIRTHHRKAPFHGARHLTSWSDMHTNSLIQANSAQRASFRVESPLFRLQSWSALNINHIFDFQMSACAESTQPSAKMSLEIRLLPDQ